MTHIKHGWGCALAAAASLAGRVAPAVADVAPSPVAIATCGDSTIEVVAGEGGGAAELRGLIASAAGARWRFTANVGLVRRGAKTRTITVEEVRTIEGTPVRTPPGGKDAAPSGLFVDLLLDDRKLVLRHASEAGADPDYAAELDRCRFGREGDAALAALVPRASEPTGCAPDLVRKTCRTQVDRVATLPDAGADREARALCEDHQQTIEARDRLEQAISDRAARDRVAARGAAVGKTEDRRVKAWNRIDGCLAAAPSKARGVAALHDAEARTRACYARIAARP